jgi:hypothetical protein
MNVSVEKGAHCFQGETSPTAEKTGSAYKTACDSALRRTGSHSLVVVDDDGGAVAVVDKYSWVVEVVNGSVIPILGAYYDSLAVMRVETSVAVDRMPAAAGASLPVAKRLQRIGPFGSGSLGS